jgi:hypothetical protein
LSPFSSATLSLRLWKGARFFAAAVLRRSQPLQVSEDARARHGTADKPRQPAAIQTVQQPSFICACAIV